MARLVKVYRSDDCIIERRQLPLTVDDNLKMIVQFNDTCTGCNQINIKQRELDRFIQKYRALSSDEIAVGLMVTNKEIFTLLAQTVPCVGCRRSVERLFTQLVETGHPSLEPLVITQTSGMSIERNVLFEPRALYALFYIHGSKLSTVMESIPKSKKNKRCVLHSLDTHKTKPLGMWMDVWDVLSPECRDEVVLVEFDCLMRTLENYLRKHRFCSECKSKVLRAYNILVGELDSSVEKGYCQALYEGLSICQEKKHIHVSCETDYIAKLVGRAEPELTGSRRERHAKTLDIAQEEVLTCIGIYIFDRLHRIWQKLRAEEQTWQILFYLGVDALRKNFEIEFEKKQGISQLELTCWEFLEEEQAKELRKEQKRQKRKKKKNKTKTEENALEVEEAEDDKDKENCKCDENTNDISVSCASCDEHQHMTKAKGSTCKSNSRSPSLTSTESQHLTKVDSTCPCDGNRHTNKEGRGGLCRSDCGYCSGQDGCDSCSTPSSRDGSDVACSEGMCNHSDDSALCNRSELPDICQDYCDSELNSISCKKRTCFANQQELGNKQLRSQTLTESADCNSKYGYTLSLQDMLEASCVSGEEDEDFLTEEEILHFKANQTQLNSKRQQLRETLRQRFANMCLCHNPSECNQGHHSHNHVLENAKIDSSTNDTSPCLSSSSWRKCQSQTKAKSVCKA